MKDEKKVDGFRFNGDANIAEALHDIADALREMSRVFHRLLVMREMKDEKSKMGKR